LRLSVLALYVALLNFLDNLFNVLGVVLFHFTPVDLGVFNAVWTAAYILPVRVAGYMADKGLFKKMSFISTASLTLSIASLAAALSTSSSPLLYAAYTAHAFAYAFGRVSVDSSLLELYESRLWGWASRSLTVRVLVFEALAYLAVSRLGVLGLVSNLHYFTLAATAAALLYIAFTPQPTLLIERTLYKLERSLARTLSAIHSTPLYLPALSSLDKPRVFEKRFSEGGVSAVSVLICLFWLRLSSEFLFTPLPAVMISRGYSSSTLMAVYGFARLLAVLLLQLMPRDLLKPQTLIAVPLTRAIAVAALYSFMAIPAPAVAFLSLIYTANSILYVALYSLYVEATYGYRLGTYTLFNELVSFIGSLLSGYAYRALGVSIVLLTAFTATAVITLLARRRT